ncbi:MAG TPA: hypothetical protein VF240_09475, partial [Pyrinomonadaceae bacterium]
MEQRKDTRAARLRRDTSTKALRLIVALVLPAMLGLVSTPHAAHAAMSADDASAAAAVVTNTLGVQERFEGQWLIDFTQRADGRVQLTLRYRNEKGTKGDSDGWNWNDSFGIDASQLHGLARETAMSAAGTSVRFQIKRDAGAIDCEGWFR